jgi:hypothetical protein
MVLIDAVGTNAVEAVLTLLIDGFNGAAKLFDRFRSMFSWRRGEASKTPTPR